MREILFRGKRTYNGHWIEGELHQYSYGGSKIKSPGVMHLELDVLPDTVGQYTGKIDRNGRKIFEGDIIDATDEWWNSYGPAGHASPIIEVKWDDFHCGFDPFADYDCDCGVYISASNCEVVGNRWDNPELLEETK